MRAALLFAVLAALALAAPAANFRWSSQGDFLTADPHAQNEGINNQVNDLVYERLTGRGKNLELVPALATSWERVNERTWRFRLRAGVKFHDGTPFSSDDVVFSLERAQSPSSNFKVFAVPLGRFRKVDALTVELETPRPMPEAVLMENLNTVRIVSKAWCEKHGVVKPQDFKTGEETYASRHANGTGPYVLVRREAEVATTHRKNPAWWGLAAGLFEGNVDAIIYRPIKSDATRMAALLSGELDFVLDPPLQDVPRLRNDRGIRIVEGPENRVIFLVLDQASEELKYASVKGRNPLKDLRVRQALYHAIDVEALRAQVMRGQARPTGSMVPTAARSFPALEPRLLPHDPARARALLKEAGYPDGFEIGLLCPNNRYVNDERICVALTAMLARVGVRVRLTSLPRAQFFQKVDNFDFDMHLYGWGGAATDPGFTLTPVLHSRDGQGRGDFNSGRYVDAELDRMIEAAEVEQDAAKRSGLMLSALQRVRHNVYKIPLHRQMIPWAARANVSVVHRADNVVEPLWVTIKWGLSLFSGGVEAVGGEHFAGAVGLAPRERGVVGREVRLRRLEELAEVSDHEVGFLERVDLVARAHDAQQVEADPVGFRAVDAMGQLPARGEDPRPVGPEPLRGLDQPEFHRVPVQAREHLDRPEAVGLQPPAAVGLEVVGEHRVEEQRHVAEEIVEDVGLDDVVELRGRAQPHGHREAAVGEVLEEHEVGQQPRHRHQPPVRRGAEARVHAVEARDAHAEIEGGERRVELVAGVARHERGLARVEAAPQGVLGLRVGVPVLLDGVVGPHARVVAAQAVDGFAGHRGVVPRRAQDGRAYLSTRCSIAPKTDAPPASRISMRTESPKARNGVAAAPRSTCSTSRASRMQA